MDPKAPESLEKRLRTAELAACKFEETSHLDDQEMSFEQTKEEERKRRAKERVDMIQALKQVETRRILFRILQVSGLNMPSFSVESGRITDYNEGRRMVGLEVLQMINFADPQAYFRMCNEHYSDEEAEKERKRNKENQ